MCQTGIDRPNRRTDENRFRKAASLMRTKRGTAITTAIWLCALFISRGLRRRRRTGNGHRNRHGYQRHHLRIFVLHRSAPEGQSWIIFRTNARGIVALAPNYRLIRERHRGLAAYSSIEVFWQDPPDVRFPRQPRQTRHWRPMIAEVHCLRLRCLPLVSQPAFTGYAGI